MQEPINVPPVDDVHQLIIFPGETAFRFAVPPQFTVDGFAVTELTGEIPLIVTVTLVRWLIHTGEFQESTI
jgi:hypothetical protein